MRMSGNLTLQILLAVIRSLQYKNISAVAIKATEEHYQSLDIVLDNRNAVIPLSWKIVNLVEPLVDRVDTIGDELVRGL